MAQEGDDLHFEVVDYDRGALQGDLMCSCVVPNKERSIWGCHHFPTRMIKHGMFKGEKDVLDS